MKGIGELLSIYLGIDAGGTKTHALLADAQGKTLALGCAGCGNWEFSGLETARAAFQAALDDALTQAGLAASDVTASAFGISGLDWPDDEPLLRGIVDKLGLSGPKVLVNDAFVALRAGTLRPWGVVVIAGTGSTKAGRNREGATARTLGLSSTWGDWGGGEDITRAGIAAVALAYAGMGPPTRLSARLAAHGGFPDVPALLRAITRAGYHPRNATHHVFEAASEGDATARAILERGGHELAKGANHVIRKLHMEAETFDLVLAGSVFKATEPLLVNTLVRDVHALAPGAHPVRLSTPPAVGGVLLAMETDGLQPAEDVQARLSEAASALC